MAKDLRGLLQSVFKARGLTVMRRDLARKLIGGKDPEQTLDLLAALPEDTIDAILPLLPRSRAQVSQDLIVLAQTGFRRNGFFVEFGATNGLDLSNTHLLEKDFGWSGILAEPARRWHADLRRNRDCHIETDCVWRATGETVLFREAEAGELSTIASFSDGDRHEAGRRSATDYAVETISLADLLEKYEAPADIDFLSIDTEGSEFDILAAFPFDRHRFRVIACEHNFTPARRKIHALLEANGYRRVMERASRFDDWYVSD